MQESEIEVLLAQARNEGRFDSSGTFTVLLRQAQNHAGKDFARLYPGGYLLKAVQCAVAAGCQDIRIDCVSSRATVQMLGPGPSRVGGQLLEALRSPLSISKQDPLGHLAICILAALAQGASLVEWCCFDGVQGEILAVTRSRWTLSLCRLGTGKARDEPASRCTSIAMLPGCLPSCI